MEITAGTLLTYPVDVPVDGTDPCTIALGTITVSIPVIVVWRLPKGYQFGASGVSGLGGPDFEDGRFDGFSRRRFRWIARSPGSRVERSYSISIEWINDQGMLQSCTVPNLKIVNKS